MDALETLAVAASTRPRCDLARSRTQVVFGVGDPEADVMLALEAA